jgi:tetratricopeptide (TPR) repeat protein
LLRGFLKQVIAARHENQARSLLERGLRSLSQRNLEDAERAFVDASRVAPQMAEPRRQLGRLLARTGKLQQAREALLGALNIDPRLAGAYGDLGNVLQLLGRGEEARSNYERGLALDPGDAVAWNNLGILYRDAGRSDDARAALRKALRLRPDLPDAVRSLVNLEPQEEDRSLLRELAALNPELSYLHAALGFLVLTEDLDPGKALSHLDEAIGLGCDDDDVHHNRGIALQDLGRIEEAIASYERAGTATARWHRSLALLLLQRFDLAWEDYELRLQHDPAAAASAHPSWLGASETEGSLLICREQGLGDEIMFASCLPDVMRVAPRCIVQCDTRLVRLFQRSFPAARIVPSDRGVPAAEPGLAPVSAQIRMGSLPRLYRRSRRDFPRHDGYLRADPMLVRSWRDRLEGLGKGLKIGVSWRGGTSRSRRHLRTVPFADLLPLLREGGAHFVNLQYDASEAEVRDLAALHGAGIVHWQEAIDDYDQTAALVCALDLTISACTAVVHLAGALGRPVWVLAPNVPEWRYGASGESMPWYPSARIFRQPAPGAWREVVHAAAASLRSGI